MSLISSIVERMIPSIKRRRLVEELDEVTRRCEEVVLKVSDLVKMRELEGLTKESLLGYVGISGIWFNLEKKEAEERLKFVTETIGEERLRQLTIYELAYLIDSFGVRKELMADLETAPEDHQESRKSIFTHFWKSYGNPFLRALRTICAVLCGAVVFTLTVWLLQGVFASVAAVFGHGRGYTPWETGLAELLLGIVVSMACRFVAPGKHAEQEFSEKLVFYGEHWFMPSRAPTGKELRATVHEVYDEARKGVLPLGKVNEEVAFRIRVRTCQTFEGACRENDLNNRKRTLAFYVFTFSAGMLGFLLEFSVYVRTALHAVDRSLLEAVTRFI